MLKLYSKDKCFYCRLLKEKLDKWGCDYTIVNIENDDAAAALMEKHQHKTVPQLYYNNIDVQKGPSTELTKDKLEDRIERIIWPSIDSGIE